MANGPYRLSRQEVRERWIKALRSNQYKQGKRALRTQRPGDKDEFCCLGVLCDLYNQLEDPKAIGKLVPESVMYRYGVDQQTAILPDEVRRWVGLRTVYGDIACRDDRPDMPLGCLTGTNDNGRTFHEIADILETPPPGLFVDV